MIDYSIGEIESLVLKSCRAAGMSWGLAEEGARSAGELSMLGLPTVEAFARLLSRLHTLEHTSVKPVISHDEISTEGAFMCPVYAGAWWMDSFAAFAESDRRVTFSCVAEPLILTSFFFRSAVKAQRAMTVSCDQIETTFTDGLFNNSLAIAEIETASTVTLTMGANAPVGWGYTHQRAACEEQSLAVLLDLAHETYVPATEASRNLGAGAGLTDND